MLCFFQNERKTYSFIFILCCRFSIHFCWKQYGIDFKHCCRLWRTVRHFKSNKVLSSVWFKVIWHFTHRNGCTAIFHICNLIAATRGYFCIAKSYYLWIFDIKNSFDSNTGNTPLLWWVIGTSIRFKLSTRFCNWFTS